MEKVGREREVPPTASEQKAVPIPRKRSGEGKVRVGKRIVDNFAMDERGKAYMLARYVINGALARMN